VLRAGKCSAAAEDGPARASKPTAVSHAAPSLSFLGLFLSRAKRGLHRHRTAPKDKPLLRPVYRQDPAGTRAAALHLSGTSRIAAQVVPRLPIYPDRRQPCQCFVALHTVDSTCGDCPAPPVRATYARNSFILAPELLTVFFLHVLEFNQIPLSYFSLCRITPAPTLQCSRVVVVI
jgi:hypothetical protein